MPVRINTNKVSEPHAATDKRCKTPFKCAAVQFNVVSRTGTKRCAFADYRTDFVCDFTATYRVFKKRSENSEVLFLILRWDFAEMMQKMQFLKKMKRAETGLYKM